MAQLARSLVNISSADDAGFHLIESRVGFFRSPHTPPEAVGQERTQEGAEPVGREHRNMQKLFGIIPFAIFFTSAPAVAEWAKIYTAENGAVLYLETSNIRQKNSHPRVWQKIDLTKVRGSALKEVIILRQMACDAQTSAQLSMTTVNMRGRVTKSTTPESLATEEHIIPGSNEWFIYVIACAEYNAEKSQ